MSETGPRGGARSAGHQSAGADELGKVETVHAIQDTWPAVGTRVQVTVGEEGFAHPFGTIAGYAMIAEGDAAEWRDGRTRMVVLVTLDGEGRWIEANRREQLAGFVRVCSVTTLCCDPSAVELADTSSAYRVRVSS